MAERRRPTRGLFERMALQAKRDAERKAKK